MPGPVRSIGLSDYRLHLVESQRSPLASRLPAVCPRDGHGWHSVDSCCLPRRCWRCGGDRSREVFDKNGIAAMIGGQTRGSNLSASDSGVRRQMNFPVSIKGVLVEAGRVVLLENERDEWELPGGRLEPGEAPENCLVREFAEELGAAVEVARIIDCWLYEVLPQREVVIITYGVKRRDESELRISDEHRQFGFFTLHEIEALPIPEGYRRSIRAWLGRPD